MIANPMSRPIRRWAAGRARRSRARGTAATGTRTNAELFGSQHAGAGGDRAAPRNSRRRQQRVRSRGKRENPDLLIMDEPTTGLDYHRGQILIDRGAQDRFLPASPLQPQPGIARASDRS
jgi:hypothetical protein